MFAGAGLASGDVAEDDPVVVVAVTAVELELSDCESDSGMTTGTYSTKEVLANV